MLDGDWSSDVCSSDLRLFALIARINVPHNPGLLIGSSVGIAIFPDDADTPAKLLERADSAMYRAKRQGGSAYCLAASLAADNAAPT
jgi:GGDEF domain-containing protein